MSCQFSGSFLLHSLKRPLLQNLKYGCISQCVSHCLYHGRACRSFKFILLKTPYATMENCEINPRNKLNCCQVIWSMGKPYHARSGMPLLRMNTSSHINFTRHSCRLYSIDGSRRTDVSGDIDKSNLISGWVSGYDFQKFLKFSSSLLHFVAAKCDVWIIFMLMPKAKERIISGLSRMYGAHDISVNLWHIWLFGYHMIFRQLYYTSWKYRLIWAIHVVIIKTVKTLENIRNDDPFHQFWFMKFSIMRLSTILWIGLKQHHII